LTLSKQSAAWLKGLSTGADNGTLAFMYQIIQKLKCFNFASRTEAVEVFSTLSTKEQLVQLGFLFYLLSTTI